MTQAPSRAQAWSRYWASGAVHSCAGSLDDGYGSIIGRYWRDAFGALPVPARVIDIGCGNGPLERLLLQTRPEPGVQCDAIDLAQLAPPPGAATERVRFHSGIAAERLPFADGSFDLVVSQYGLEYAELDRACAEVRRVRAPSSRVRLIVHHAQSLPVSLAREELGHLEWALGAAGLPVAAADLLEPLQRARTEAGRRSLADDASAKLARDAFNSAQDWIDARAASSSCPDALIEMRAAVGQALEAASRGDPDRGRAVLAQLRSAQLDAQLRLRELCAHAMGDGAAREMAAALRCGDETVRVQALADGATLWGWSVELGG